MTATTMIPSPLTSRLVLLLLAGTPILQAATDSSSTLGALQTFFTEDTYPSFYESYVTGATDPLFPGVSDNSTLIYDAQDSSIDLSMLSSSVISGFTPISPVDYSSVFATYSTSYASCNDQSSTAGDTANFMPACLISNMGTYDNIETLTASQGVNMDYLAARKYDAMMTNCLFTLGKYDNAAAALDDNISSVFCSAQKSCAILTHVCDWASSLQSAYQDSNYSSHLQSAASSLYSYMDCTTLTDESSDGGYGCIGDSAGANASDNKETMVDYQGMLKSFISAATPYYYSTQWARLDSESNASLTATSSYNTFASMEAVNTVSASASPNMCSVKSTEITKEQVLARKFLNTLMIYSDDLSPVPLMMPDDTVWNGIELEAIDDAVSNGDIDASLAANIFSTRSSYEPMVNNQLMTYNNTLNNLMARKSVADSVFLEQYHDRASQVTAPYDSNASCSPQEARQISSTYRLSDDSMPGSKDNLVWKEQIAAADPVVVQREQAYVQAEMLALLQRISEQLDTNNALLATINYSLLDKGFFDLKKTRESIEDNVRTYEQGYADKNSSSGSGTPGTTPPSSSDISAQMASMTS